MLVTKRIKMSPAVAHVKHLYRTEDNGHWIPVDRRVASGHLRLATGDKRDATCGRENIQRQILE